MEQHETTATYELIKLWPYLMLALAIIITIVVILLLARWYNRSRKRPDTTLLAILLLAAILTGCSKEQLSTTSIAPPPAPSVEKPNFAPRVFKTKQEGEAWVASLLVKQVYSYGLYKDTATIKAKIAPEAPNDPPEYPGPDPEGTYVTIIYIGGGGGGPFYFTVSAGMFAGAANTQGGGIWSLQNIVSDIRGITTGLFWQQTQAYYYNVPNSTAVHFEIMGVMSFGWMYAGFIPIYGKQNMMISGWYNMKNGSSHMTSYPLVINPQ